MSDSSYSTFDHATAAAIAAAAAAAAEQQGQHGDAPGDALTASDNTRTEDAETRSSSEEHRRPSKRPRTGRSAQPPVYADAFKVHQESAGQNELFVGANASRASSSAMPPPPPPSSSVPQPARFVQMAFGVHQHRMAQLTSDPFQDDHHGYAVSSPRPPPGVDEEQSNALDADVQDQADGVVNEDADIVEKEANALVDSLSAAEKADESGGRRSSKGGVRKGRGGKARGPTVAGASTKAETAANGAEVPEASTSAIPMGAAEASQGPSTSSATGAPLITADLSLPTSQLLASLPVNATPEQRAAVVQQALRARNVIAIQSTPAPIEQEKQKEETAAAAATTTTTDIRKAGSEGPPACDICRKQKLKCSRTIPCDRCQRLGKQCTVDDPLMRRGPPTKRQRKILAQSGMRYLTFRDRIKEKKRIRTLLESGQPLTPNDMELLANLTSNPRDLFVNMSTGTIVSSGPQDEGHEHNGPTATSQDPPPPLPAPIFNPDNYILDPNASDAGENAAAIAQLTNFPPELLAHLSSVLHDTADDTNQTETGDDRPSAQQQLQQAQAQQQARSQGTAQAKTERGRRGQQAAQSKPGRDEAIEALLRLRGEDEGEGVSAEPQDGVNRSDTDKQTAPPPPPEPAEASAETPEKRSVRYMRRKE